MDIAIDSTVFYLNDILNTLNAIAGKTAGRALRGNKAGGRGEPGGAGRGEAGPDLKPDARAFWDTSDYDARVKLNSIASSTRIISSSATSRAKPLCYPTNSNSTVSRRISTRAR